MHKKIDYIGTGLIIVVLVVSPRNQHKDAGNELASGYYIVILK